MSYLIFIRYLYNSVSQLLLETSSYCFHTLKESSAHMKHCKMKVTNTGHRVGAAELTKYDGALADCIQRENYIN